MDKINCHVLKAVRDTMYKKAKCWFKQDLAKGDHWNLSRRLFAITFFKNIAIVLLTHLKNAQGLFAPQLEARVTGLPTLKREGIRVFQTNVDTILCLDEIILGVGQFRLSSSYPGKGY
jgi:hypothetical protein